jgi:hypothetical protein
MHANWCFTFILLISSFLLHAQSKFAGIQGNWKISYYENPYHDTIIKKGDNGCEDFLFLEIASNGKMLFKFTNQQKSYTCKGRIKPKKNKSIKITNNIHEIVFLGELEACISATLRMHFRSMFYRTFRYGVENNKLTFYYDLPDRPDVLRTIVFTRI